MPAKNAKSSVISIGDELLSGLTLDTNFTFLADSMRRVGLLCCAHFTVRDTEKDIIQALKRAAAVSDVIFTIGGLGPTEDDITIETVAEFAGKKLDIDTVLLKSIKARFRKRGLKMPKCSEKQAVFPKGCQRIKNRVGMAPGLIIPYQEKLIICLPGPPREFEPMVKNDIVKFMKKEFALSNKIFSRTIKLSSLPESGVNESLRDLFGVNKDISIGICANPGEIDISLYAPAKDKRSFRAVVSPVVKRIYERLGDFIYGEDEDTLEAVVGGLLKDKGLTLASAESCTGGLVSKRITEVAGSSAYFMGGVVSYDNSVKTSLLSVPAALIRSKGVVSREVVEVMAKNVASVCGADIGVGISGVAGPSGGTDKKPVGLVCVAVSVNGVVESYEFNFPGSRKDIRRCASTFVLELIRKKIK